MAFFFITGVMGSGKSYKGAELILECLREGGVVHTNLPLRMDVMEELGYLDRIVILPNQIQDLVTSVPGKLDTETGIMGKPTLSSKFLVAGAEGAENLVVIDEASLEFDIDTQMKDREKNKPLFQLVALCRHVGLDLYFLAQHQGNVDAKLRKLAEHRIKCVKTERLPFIGWFFAKMYGDFLRIYYQGQDNTSIGRTWHRFDKEVGEAYDTHGMRGGIEIKQGATRRKGMEFTAKKGRFRAFAVLALIVGLIGFSMLRGKQAVAAIQKGREDGANASSSPAPVVASDGRTVVGEAAEAIRNASKDDKPVLKKRDWAEWLQQDEQPYMCIIRKAGQPVRVQVRGGDFMSVGGTWEGELLLRCVEQGKWFYFETDQGRWVVARPFTGAERHKIWQEAINRGKESLPDRMMGQ